MAGLPCPPRNGEGQEATGPDASGNGGRDEGGNVGEHVYDSSIKVELTVIGSEAGKSAGRMNCHGVSPLAMTVDLRFVLFQRQGEIS
jgi:hypothetical protein